MAKRVALAILACATLVGVVAAQAPAPLLTPESKLPARHSVPVFGLKIVYYDVGSGPVIVLVHGFGSEARFDWGNVLLILSQHHRVIALDQIGFGGSDKPFIDYSVQTYVDFLGEFLRTLKVHEFTLAGESLGDGYRRFTRSNLLRRRTLVATLCLCRDVWYWKMQRECRHCMQWRNRCRSRSQALSPMRTGWPSSSTTSRA